MLPPTAQERRVTPAQGSGGEWLVEALQMPRAGAGDGEVTAANAGQRRVDAAAAPLHRAAAQATRLRGRGSDRPFRRLHHASHALRRAGLARSPELAVRGEPDAALIDDIAHAPAAQGGELVFPAVAPSGLFRHLLGSLTGMTADLPIAGAELGEDGQ